MKLSKTIRFYNNAYHVILKIQWSGDSLSEKEKEVFEAGAEVELDVGGCFESERPDVDFCIPADIRKFPFKAEIRQVFGGSDDCSLERANLKAIVYFTQLRDRIVNARDRLIAEHSRQTQNSKEAYYDKY